MNLKSKNGVCGIIASIMLVLALSIYAFAGDQKVQCIEKEIMFDLIERIPKNFPLAEKDNVYTIDKNSHGALTAVVDNLNVRFFDSRDPDSKKWCSVCNTMFKDAFKEDVSQVGCVIAGINNYDTGRVDDSPGAKDIAQQRFNEYVTLAQSLMKK